MRSSPRKPLTLDEVRREASRFGYVVVTRQFVEDHGTLLADNVRLRNLIGYLRQPRTHQRITRLTTTKPERVKV